jgi:hypothetical protein
MKLLVLAPHAVDAAAVRGALPGEDLDGSVVSPALNPSGLRFWMSDSDDAVVRAEQAAGDSVDALRDDGLRARGTAGESEPLLALQDALATFPADRIVIFRGDGSGYREEQLASARERFDVPVTEV